MLWRFYDFSAPFDCARAILSATSYAFIGRSVSVLVQYTYICTHVQRQTAVGCNDQPSSQRQLYFAAQVAIHLCHPFGRQKKQVDLQSTPVHCYTASFAEDFTPSEIWTWALVSRGTASTARPPQHDSQPCEKARVLLCSKKPRWL